MKLRYIVLACSLGLAITSLSFGQVPVINGYPPAQGASGQGQQPGLAELYNQIQTLQLQVQQLQGQLEVQSHDLKLMEKQQRNLYKDLDSRVSQLAKAERGKAAKPSSAKAPAPVINASMPINDKTQGMSSSAGQAVPVRSVTNGQQAAPVAESAPAPSADPQAEYQSYEKAYSLLLQKQYDQAILGMQAFLQQYPNGKYAPNANYWLGELYLLQGKLPQATSSFSQVIAKFPKSNKVPDAMLKLGFIYFDQGNMPQAQRELSKVQQQYPNSPAARLAAERLQTIQQQGSI